MELNFAQAKLQRASIEDNGTISPTFSTALHHTSSDSGNQTKYSKLLRQSIPVEGTSGGVKIQKCEFRASHGTGPKIQEILKEFEKNLESVKEYWTEDTGAKLNPISICLDSSFRL